jgi:hypothetical protein
MSVHRKWFFVLAGLVCIVLALAGGILYPPTSWGILTPTLYVSVIVLFSLGILRLVYLRGFPE